MAVSFYCKINFQGRNGGYLMINQEGKLQVSTNPYYGTDYQKLIFEKDRVGLDRSDDREKILFRSAYNKMKYITAHGYTVTSEPLYIEGKIQSNSYWELKSVTEIGHTVVNGVPQQVVIYHPDTRYYLVVYGDSDFRLSNSDDAKEKGVFVLEKPTS